MTPTIWSPPRGLEPTPEQGRQWLNDELNGPGYHDSWVDQVIRWVTDKLSSLLDGVSKAGGALSPVITIILAVLVIALLVWILPKVRRESSVARSGGAVLEDPSITPDAYRALAARALAEGRYDDAVLDGFRAIAKDMSNRTLLDDAPGRTAHEVSLALAVPFPARADRLVLAANVFDAVRYGHRRATVEQASEIRALDTELTKARPAPVTTAFPDAAALDDTPLDDTPLDDTPTLQDQSV